jgi:hypothetical protein
MATSPTWVLGLLIAGIALVRVEPANALDNAFKKSTAASGAGSGEASQLQSNQKSLPQLRQMGPLNSSTRQQQAPTDIKAHPEKFVNPDGTTNRQ